MLLLALAVIFVIGPIVELYVIIQVAHVVGAWQTIALLLVEGAIGAWLIKRQGRRALARIQAALQSGQLPTKELVDGGLILFAGALMVAPGFITDILGFLLLIPPSRALFRMAVMRHFKDRITTGSAFLGGFGGAGGRFATFGFGADDVFDTTGREQARYPELRDGDRP